MALTIEWAKITENISGIHIWGKHSSGRSFTVKVYHGEIATEDEGRFKFRDRIIQTHFGTMDEIDAENARDFLKHYHMFMDTCMFMVIYGAITAPL